MTYYAYLHCKPNGIPFYVGKGMHRRIHDFKNNRNQHYLNTVAKYGDANIIIAKLECFDEDDAFALEVELIKLLKLMSVPLVNQTDGGEGPSGRKLSEAHIEAIRSSWRIKKHHTVETRAKMSMKQKGRIVSAESKEKMSIEKKGKAPFIGEAHPNFGKPLSEETRAKISAAGKGIPKIKSPCTVCGKICAHNILKRFHNDNCKLKGNDSVSTSSSIQITN